MGPRPLLRLAVPILMPMSVMQTGAPCSPRRSTAACSLQAKLPRRISSRQRMGPGIWSGRKRGAGRTLSALICRAVSPCDSLRGSGKDR